MTDCLSTIDADRDAEIASTRVLVDTALLDHVERLFKCDSPVREAVMYALTNGGSRWRPLLLLTVGRAYGASDAALLPMACAVEALHTVSLLLDDLPCMDDAGRRRGLPATHIVYGEGITVLAAHFLQAASFEIIRSSYPLHYSGDLLKLISDMTAGQAADISTQGRGVSTAESERIARLKSGRLFAFSAKMGALLGGAPDRDGVCLEQFGEELGLAYQILDDLLDSGDYTVRSLLEARDTSNYSSPGSFIADAGRLERIGVCKRTCMAMLDAISVKTEGLEYLINRLLTL